MSHCKDGKGDYEWVSCNNLQGHSIQSKETKRPEKVTINSSKGSHSISSTALVLTPGTAACPQASTPNSACLLTATFCGVAVSGTLINLQL